jgi:hypothetical protein
MVLPTTNISASLVSDELNFATANRPFKFSEHFANVLEQDGPAKMSMKNLRGKQASVNIDVWGYRYDWPYNSTPSVKITDFFPYMTDDDWFSVDVAVTESQLISNQVFRVFFKYSSSGLNDIPFYKSAFRPIDSSVAGNTTQGPNVWKRGERVSAPPKRLEKIGGIAGYTTGMEYEPIIPTDLTDAIVGEEFYSISDGMQIIFPTTYKEKTSFSWQVYGGKPNDSIEVMFYSPAAAFFADNSNKKVITSSNIKLDENGYGSKTDDTQLSWYVKAGMEVAAVFYYNGMTSRSALSFKVVSSTDNQAINVYNQLKLQKYVVRQDYTYKSVSELPDPTKLQINQGSSPSLRIVYPEFIKKGAAKFAWYVSGGVPNEEFYVTEKNSGKRWPTTGNWTLDGNGNWFDTNGYVAPDDPWGGPVSFSFIFTKSGTVIKNGFILDSNAGQNGSFNNDNMQYIVVENGLYYKYYVEAGASVYVPASNQLLRKSWKRLISGLTTSPDGLKIVTELPDPNKYKANDGVSLQITTQGPSVTWTELVPDYDTVFDGDGYTRISTTREVVHITPGGVTIKYDSYVLIEELETSTTPIEEPNDRYEDIENRGSFRSNYDPPGFQWYGWMCNGSNNDQTSKNILCGTFYNPVSKDIFAGALYQGIDTPDKFSRVRLTKITYWPKGVATKDQEYPLYTNDAGAGYYTNIDPAIIRGWQENFYIEPTKDNATYWQNKLDSKEYTVDRMLDFFAKYPAGNDAMWNTRMFSTQQKLRVKMAKLYTTYISKPANQTIKTVPSYVNNYYGVKWCDVVNPLNSAQKGPPNLYNNKVTMLQSEIDQWGCNIVTPKPTTSPSTDVLVWVEIPGWSGDAEAYDTLVVAAMKSNPALAHDVAANKRLLNDETDPPAITKWCLSSWYLGPTDSGPNLPLYIHGQHWFKDKYGIDATNPANRGKFYCDFPGYKGFYDLYKEGDVICLLNRVTNAFEDTYNTEAFFKLYKAPKLVLLDNYEIFPSTGYATFNTNDFFNTHSDHYLSWDLTNYTYPFNPYASYMYNANAKDSSFRKVRFGRNPNTNLKFGSGDTVTPQGYNVDNTNWLNINDMIYAYDYWSYFDTYDYIKTVKDVWGTPGMLYDSRTGLYDSIYNVLCRNLFNTINPTQEQMKKVLLGYPDSTKGFKGLYIDPQNITQLIFDPFDVDRDKMYYPLSVRTDGGGIESVGPSTNIPNNQAIKVYFKKYQLQWAGSQAEKDKTIAGI